MSDMNKCFSINSKYIIFAGMAYLAFQNILFLAGWTIPIYALCTGALLLLAIVKASRSGGGRGISLSAKSLLCLTLAFLIAALWIECISFHHHSPHHGDYYFRNLIYEQISTRSWPMVDSERNYFVYYFTFWLPPAFLSKLTSIFSKETWLFLWALMGMTIALSLIYTRLNHRILFFTVAFLFFGTLTDWHRIICGIYSNIEELASVRYFLQEAFPHQFLVWVTPWDQVVATFNHAIPFLVFLGIYFARCSSLPIVIVSSVLLLSSSPLGGIASLPFLVYRFMHECKLRGWWVTLRLSLCYSLLMLPLLVGVALYLISVEASSASRFVWMHADGTLKETGEIITTFKQLFIIFLNIVLMYIIGVKKPFRNPYCIPLLITLFIINFVWIGMERVNELYYKGSMLVSVTIVLLITLSWPHFSRTRRAVIALMLIASSAFSVYYVASRARHYTWDTLECELRAHQLRGVDLGDPQHKLHKQFWSGKKDLPCIFKAPPADTTPFCS